MAEWQPIKTAPKDGTWIAAIGHLSHGTPDTLKWKDGGWWNGYDNHDHEPTHWYPLPAAAGVEGTLEPEPGWFLPYEAVKHLTSLPKLLEHARRARWTNAVVRKDGVETTYEADWIKHMRWVSGGAAYEGRAFVAGAWQAWHPISAEVYENRKKWPRDGYEVRVAAGVDVPGEGKR